MSHTTTEIFQPLAWPFPGILPNVQAQQILAESSTSYLRSAHRQHQVSVQKAHKRTKEARNRLNDSQMVLKRLRREKQGLVDKRSQLAQKTRAKLTRFDQHVNSPLEPEIEVIDPSILQAELDDVMAESASPEGLTSEHIVLFAKLEREIQAVQLREGSLRELEAELATVKKLITDIRHCAIIADGSLGELDKVVRTVSDRLEEAVIVAGGPDAALASVSNDTEVSSSTLDTD